MATPAHCAYCFECLSASFDRRQPLSLQQVQELWEEYTQNQGTSSTLSGDDDMTNIDDEPARPAAISRLLNRTAPSSASSSSSLPSTKSSTASSATTNTPASSRSSLVSSSSSKQSARESHPLFVTWNTISRSSSHKSLRGCIGTFEAQDLQDGLRSYALTSAFDDHRFSPIPASLLPSLQVCVTLLTNFSAPSTNPMDWTIGEHGLRLSFSNHGRRYGATYLPDVVREQGWTKEETIVSLMRKAGWNGRKDEWRKVSNLEIVRYEGAKVDLNYAEYKAFMDWMGKKNVRSKPLN